MLIVKCLGTNWNNKHVNILDKMNLYLIFFVLLMGHFTVSSLMDDENKSKYLKQTMRYIGKLRRRFKLPKHTSVEKVLSYYRTYQGIVDQPAHSYFPSYYATPYRKRSFHESQQLIILR